MPTRTDTPVSWGPIGTCGAVLLATFLWSYWPTLVGMVSAWDREADYSHGYLVVPLAAYFLWVRRDRFPGIDRRYAWLGLSLIAGSIGLRVVGAWVYIDAVDGWSILLWVAGTVWILLGHRVAWWSAPSIAFLAFMIPLPFMAERALSLPLQRVATKLSVFSLQFLGQPALAEGNVIVLGDHRLEVAAACSGLRIFMGIIALACAYLVLVRRPWWQKAILFVAIAPVALIANATRIVITGLVFQFFSSESARHFSHDVAGWLMIPWAAALFGFVLWYLGKLIREEECLDPRRIPRRTERDAKVEPVS